MTPASVCSGVGATTTYCGQAGESAVPGYGHPRATVWPGARAAGSAVRDHQRNQRSTETWQSHPSGPASASADTSPPKASTPTTRCAGSAGTPGSPTTGTAPWPSSSSGVEVPESWSLNATNILAQKYFRGTLGHPRARVVAQAGGRPRRRHHHRLGHEGRLLRRRRRGRDLPRRAEAPHHPPEGRLQLAGLVQHRGARGAPAGERLLHPVGRGLDGLDPQLVHRRGRHLQGRVGRRASTSRGSAPRTSC